METRFVWGVLLRNDVYWQALNIERKFFEMQVGRQLARRSRDKGFWDSQIGCY